MAAFDRSKPVRRDRRTGTEGFGNPALETGLSTSIRATAESETVTPTVFAFQPKEGG